MGVQISVGADKFLLGKMVYTYLFEGKILSDTSTISEYKIQENNFVVVMPNKARNVAAAKPSPSTSVSYSSSAGSSECAESSECPERGGQEHGM